MEVNNFTKSLHAFLFIIKELVELQKDPCDEWYMDYAAFSSFFSKFNTNTTLTKDEKKLVIVELKKMFLNNMSPSSLGLETIYDKPIFVFPPHKGEALQMENFAFLREKNIVIKGDSLITETLPLSKIFTTSYQGATGKISNTQEAVNKYLTNYIKLLLTLFTVLSFSNFDDEYMPAIIETKDRLYMALTHFSNSNKQSNSPLDMIKNLVGDNKDLLSIIKNFGETLDINKNIPNILNNIKRSTGMDLGAVNDILQGKKDINEVITEVKDTLSSKDKIEKFMEQHKDFVDGVKEEITSLITPHNDEKEEYKTEEFTEDD